MEIRPLRESDIGACLEIYQYYIENTTYTFEEERLDEALFAARVRRITERFPFLVAVEEGKIVGYAYLDRFHERSAYRYTADLSIYLDHRVLHRGVGSLLYAAIESAAREAGFCQLLSLVTAENAGSVAFHEKHGFVLRGELPDVGYKFNRWLGVRYYQKTL